MLRANVLKRFIHESLLLAPDLASFKRQESIFVVLNLFVLAILLLTQSLFSSYLGAPSSIFVAVLGVGFLLNVLEMLWLRRIGFLNGKQVLILTWCSIVLNMMLAFALASLSNRRDAQYFALMALPVVQQGLRIEYGLRLGCSHRASLEAIPDNSCREFMPL